MRLPKFQSNAFKLGVLTHIFSLLLVPCPFMRANTVEEFSTEIEKFSKEDCIQIAANATCSCQQIKNNTTIIECADNKVYISINAENGIEVTCKERLEPNVLATLPQLGALRKTRYFATFNCQPVTAVLAQMTLTPRETLHMYGLAAYEQLRPNVFGTELERLQNVTVLELRAESKIRLGNNTEPTTQQLASDILQKMPQLFRLTLDLKFTQLPAELFNSVVNLNDLSLIGALSEFPRQTLRVLHRLRELTLRGHHLLNHLHETDFQNLTTIRGLYMTNCSITELPAHIFAPLKQLQRLNLMGNKLHRLPVMLLAQQQRLQILNLSGNQLQLLPIGLFTSTAKLLKLNLSHNRLRHLDSKILPPLTAVIELLVANNELRTIAAGTFAQPNRLQGLDLSNNLLDWAAAEDCTIFDGLKRLQRLLLSNNSLHYLCDTLGSNNHTTSALTNLDVRQNKLKFISPQLLETLNTSASMSMVYLADNPWVCNCSAQPLLNFVKSNRRRLQDARNMRCANAADLPRLRDLSFRDFCLPEFGVQTVVVVMLVCASALGLLLTTTALCYYKYNMELKIWLYAHQLCLCCLSEKDVDRDRKWDAFISYSHHDEQFVEKELVPGLEQGQPSFKVCIHVRDWLAGAYIPEQIIDSVEQSRRTIIVLSQHFIASDWAQMEFRTAHQCAVNEGRSRIIIVVYGEIKDTELLDQELRAYLKTNTYLKWGDPWFWRKLRYAMPHEQRVRWTREANDSDIENNVEPSVDVDKNKQ